MKTSDIGVDDRANIPLPADSAPVFYEKKRKKSALGNIFTQLKERKVCHDPVTCSLA